MEQVIENLFARWNLENVKIVGEEVWANCPFHGERKPSFSVNITTGKFHCFSCHESGNELKELVAKMEGVPLAHADDLLEDYGIDTLAVLKQELRTLFHATVAKRIDQKKIFDLTEDESWRIFDGHVSPYMLARGFDRRTLLRHHVGHDTMRRMVMIPVFEGKVCRFVYSRIAWKRKSKKASYDYPFNIDRGMYLWGIDKPEHEFHDKPLFVCEGAFDALRFRQFGYPNSVAILGSYLTKVQQAKIENLNPSEIILAFDNDKAGFDATIFAGKMLLRAGFRRVYYLPYPKGLGDPAKATQEQLTRMVARKKSVRQLVWNNPTPIISTRLERLLQ